MSVQIVTCPLCCSTSLTDHGTVFERRYVHEPVDGVIRPREVITHHSVLRCGHCSASSINGSGVDVPAELVAGVMRRGHCATCGNSGWYGSRYGEIGVDHKHCACLKSCLACAKAQEAAPSDEAIT